MIRRARRAQEPSVGSPRSRAQTCPRGRKQATAQDRPRGGAATGPDRRRSPQARELLLEKRYITGTQLSETLLQQSVSGKRLGTRWSSWHRRRGNLAAALAEQLSLPLIDLSDQVPSPTPEDAPETVARSLGALPLATPPRASRSRWPTRPEDEGRLSRQPGPGAAPRRSPSDVKRPSTASTGRSRHRVRGAGLQLNESAAGRAGAPAASAPRPGGQGRHARPHPGPARPRLGRPHRAPEDRLRVRYRIDGALHDVLALPPAWRPRW